ncbi:MAG: hypothetical protein NUV77_07500 [Thermoguttaceae bacterium]|jgi:DNA-directed RNA polymerase specialized sigma24 family protein|nr:hypothetical protein [Thermoguttaceae bacterium]
MSFPPTRLTLIQRLASTGTAEDWRVFVRDYWGPVCRFVLRCGCLSLANAEEVAAETFSALWQGRLLVRWVEQRVSRLRTLICSVVWRILANRKRNDDHRHQLLGELAQNACPGQYEQDDVFYAAWVDDLLQRAIERLAAEYYEADQGDYVRVLYSRVCEGLSVAQTAAALDIMESDVTNYYRHARERLTEKLRCVLRNQIWRYCTPEEVEEEFAREWKRLGSHLATYGGIENAIREAYNLLNPVFMSRHPQEFLGGHYTDDELKTLSIWKECH